MTPLIEFNNVTLAYGFNIVLQHVNLSVESGETWVITGPNGSGKTTLLKAMAGLIAPLKGQIVRRFKTGDFGWLTHDASAYPAWQVKDLFQWFKSMFFPHQEPALDDKRFLKSIESYPYNTLSRGMRQRFFLTLLNVWSPMVIVLDEPFTGLDTDGQQWCLSLIQTWKEKGLTVILTTHHPITVENALHLSLYRKKIHLIRSSTQHPPGAPTLNR